MTNMTHTSIAQDESGRTLTELLVVLVIMGFLSLAFIRGYVWAMDMYHASETMNEMEVRATTLATFYGREAWPNEGTSVTLQEFGNTTNHGYPITMTIKSGGMFVFAVSNVPVKVCEKILRDWRMVEWLMVGGDNPEPNADSPHYFDFSNPNHNLCSEFATDAEDNGQKVVKMYFWFHRELDLCQGDNCGTTPDGESSVSEDAGVGGGTI